MDNIILIQNGILMRIETRLYRHISYVVCRSLVAQSIRTFDELMINVHSERQKNRGKTN